MVIITQFFCVLLQYLCIILVFVSNINAEFNNVLFPNHQLQWSERKKLEQWFNPLIFQTKAKGIPLDMVIELNSVENEKQFLEKFVENGSAYTTPNLNEKMVPFQMSANTPGEHNTTHNYVTQPKFASCTSELTVVNLRDTDDPTVFYFPSCVRIERCGGCCNHELLKCQPTQIEFLNYTIHATKFVGKRKLVPTGQKSVTLEKHLLCECDCKLKPKDCTPHQKYQKDDCNCECTNKQEESKCSEDNRKLWNPLSCLCQCQVVHDCPTGFHFDMINCNCNKTAGSNEGFMRFSD